MSQLRPLSRRHDPISSCIAALTVPALARWVVLLAGTALWFLLSPLAHSPAQAEPSPPQFPAVAGVFKVRANGGARVRVAPHTTAHVVTKVADGTQVTVLCGVKDGAPVRTRSGGVSRVWDRTPQGWISDVLVMTNTWKPVGLDCSAYDRQLREAQEQQNDINLMNELMKKNGPVPCIGQRHQGLDRAHAARVFTGRSFTQWEEVGSTPWEPPQKDVAEDKLNREKLVEEAKKKSPLLRKVLGKVAGINSVEARLRLEDWHSEWCERVPTAPSGDGMMAQPAQNVTVQVRVTVGGLLPMDDDPTVIPVPIVVNLITYEETVGPIEYLTAEMDKQALGCMPDSITCFQPGQNTAPSHPGAQGPPRQPR